MVDLKKLIGGFLILAAIMSSAALIFLNSSQNNVGAVPAEKNLATASAKNQEPAQPDNAFSSPILSGGNVAARAALASAGTIKEKDLPQPEFTGNLTNDFAQNVARQLILANPAGPQQTADGQTAINAPDANSVIGGLADLPGIKNFEMPDWNEEVASIKLDIIGSNSSADREKYAEALNDLFNNYFFRPDLTNIVSGDPNSLTAADLSPAAKVFAGAIGETKSTVVPSALADFHKSFLTVLVYEKKFADLGASAEEDPLKASLIAKAKDKDMDKAIADLLRQSQKPDLQKTISARPEVKAGVLALINGFVGIKIAYAQAQGIFVPVNDPAAIASINANTADREKITVEGIIRAILLQVLKNTIAQQIQSLLVKFVQGAGAPKFITNWLGYQTKAFKQAANLSASQSTAGASPSFQNIIKAVLKTQNAAPKSTIDQIVPNLTSFYNDFSQGGWNGYSALLEPQNNVFGFLILAHDKQLADAASALSAAQNQAVAGQGFPGTASSPTSGSGDCKIITVFYPSEAPDKASAMQAVGTQISDAIEQDYGGQGTETPITCTDNQAAGKTCSTDQDCGLGGVCDPVAGYCSAGGGSCTGQACKALTTAQQLLTTPGATIGHALDNALATPQFNSQSANSIVGLLAGWISSMVNKLTQGNLLGL